MNGKTRKFLLNGKPVRNQQALARFDEWSSRENSALNFGRTQWKKDEDRIANWIFLKHTNYL